MSDHAPIPKHVCREWPITGGVTLFPYQVAFGLSIRWGDFKAIRLYCGPIKVWLSITEEEQ